MLRLTIKCMNMFSYFITTPFISSNKDYYHCCNSIQCAKCALCKHYSQQSSSSLLSHYLQYLRLSCQYKTLKQRIIHILKIVNSQRCANTLSIIKLTVASVSRNCKFLFPIWAVNKDARKLLPVENVLNSICME